MIQNPTDLSRKLQSGALTSRALVEECFEGISSSGPHGENAFLSQYKKKQGNDENNWQGEAIVVMQDTRKTTVILPDLALEPKLQRQDNAELDQSLTVQLQSVNIPELQVIYSI